MFSATIVATLLSALAALADPTPQEPSPGAVFKEGGPCTISWGADPLKTWTTMQIELMTGDNFNMQYLTTVATVDATKVTTFSYTCPKVTPHSMIYFYQFSTPAAPLNNTWTGRFTITDSTGTTTPPTENTNGIAWGNGKLVDPGSAAPEPSYLTNPPAGAQPPATGAGSASGSAPGGMTGGPPAPTTTPGPPPPKGNGGNSGSQPTDVTYVTVTSSDGNGNQLGAANGSTGTGGANASPSPNAAGAVAAVDLRALVGLLFAVLAFGDFVGFY